MKFEAPAAVPRAVARVRAPGVLLRNAASLSASLGTRCIRIAVQDVATDRRMLKVLRLAADGIGAISSAQNQFSG